MRSTTWMRPAALLPLLALLGGCTRGAPAPMPGAATSVAQAGGADLYQSVVRGRQLVLQHDCGGCHGGFGNPDSPEWLSGARRPDQFDQIGPFKTRAANITPDSATGIGRYTERQLFNALRYGLKPGETPDVEITASTPGQGNFPAAPHYLAPPMPWMWWRHMSDQELHDVAAYLKHGVRPVRNAVTPSEGPPDHWAGEWTDAKYGAYPTPAFPAAHEVDPGDAAREQVTRGRALVQQLACAGCHGGNHPAGEGYLAGARTPQDEFTIGPFKTRPRNLTPDNTTGIGRFTERQIFNALRYGLRPGETPDVEITSNVPGQGNFPRNPKYLAPPMPWPAWRHLSDQQLQDVAAYLKHGVKPVTNRVPDSEGPPDFWASEYTAAKYGTYPAPAFPAKGERMP